MSDEEQPSPSPEPSRTVIVTIDEPSTYTSGSYLVVAEPTGGADWESSPTSFPDPVASSGGGKKLGILEIVAIAVGGVALLVTVALAIYFYSARVRRRRKEDFEAKYGKGIQHIYNHQSLQSTDFRAPSRIATPTTAHSRSSSSHNSPPSHKISKARSVTPNTPQSGFAKLAEETQGLELDELGGEEEITVYTYEEGKRAKEDMWKAAGYSGSPKVPPLPSIAPSIRSAWSRPGETDRGSVTGSEVSPTSATASRRTPGRRDLSGGPDTVVLPSYYYPSGP